MDFSDTFPSADLPTSTNGHLDANAGPHCPACGFRVFNRRYPKCESCGAELPDDVAYSAAERHSLIEREEELARAAARVQRPSSDSAFGTTSFDDAVVSALVTSTER